MSVLHLVVISVERFVAIKYPFRYDSIVKKFRLTVAVVCCWQLVTVYIIYRISTDLRKFPGYVILFVFCHTYVYFICRRHEIQIQSEQFSQKATAKFLKEKKACKTTSIIIGGVFICYYPGVVISILPEIFSDFLIRRICLSFRPLGFTFLIANSLCNPIIYCWKNKEIREASMLLVKKKTANEGLV